MNFLDIHTHLKYKNVAVNSIFSVDVVINSKPVFLQDQPYSLGLHPWTAKLAQLPEQLRWLETWAAMPNVVAIGECGLDKLRGEPLENQLEIFKAQAKLAQMLHKPLIIHCVKAFDELIAIKKELNITVPMIIHGFNKNEALGLQLVQQGFILSFGKALLNPNSGAAKLIQLIDEFFLETDGGDATIETIYAAAAKLKNCSVDELKARIFTNWKINKS